MRYLNRYFFITLLCFSYFNFADAKDSIGNLKSEKKWYALIEYSQGKKSFSAEDKKNILQAATEILNDSKNTYAKHKAVMEFYKNFPFLKKNKKFMTLYNKKIMKVFDNCFRQRGTSYPCDVAYYDYLKEQKSGHDIFYQAGLKIIKIYNHKASLKYFIAGQKSYDEDRCLSDQYESAILSGLNDTDSDYSKQAVTLGLEKCKPVFKDTFILWLEDKKFDSLAKKSLCKASKKYSYLKPCP